LKQVSVIHQKRKEKSDANILHKATRPTSEGYQRRATNLNVAELALRRQADAAAIARHAVDALPGVGPLPNAARPRAFAPFTPRRPVLAALRTELQEHIV